MMLIQDYEKLNQEKGDLGHFMVSLEFNYVPSLWVLKLEIGWGWAVPSSVHDVAS